MRCPPRGLHSAAEGGAWGDPRDSESVTLESERREEEDAPRAAPKHEGARGRGGGLTVRVVGGFTLTCVCPSVSDPNVQNDLAINNWPQIYQTIGEAKRITYENWLAVLLG